MIQKLLALIALGEQRRRRAQAVDLLAELLTAERDPDPEVYTATYERVDAELAADHELRATFVTVLVRLAALPAATWCAEDGGDWARTVARIRERALG